MLKIGSAVDVRCRYHLAQVWTGPTRHFVDQYVPKEIGACGFAAGEEVFRRRRDKCV